MIDPIMETAIRELLLFHPKLTSVLFDGDDIVAILNITDICFGMSRGEKLLIELACHLIFQENKIDLNELIYKLDSTTFMQFIRAITILRPEIKLMKYSGETESWRC